MEAGSELLADVRELLAIDLARHFHQLVLTMQQRLYTFALRHTESPQDAEDIVQEAFIRAYHALQTIRRSGYARRSCSSGYTK
jgi:RNA polymerase sigma-70 factor, ECF subfamily